MISTLFGEVEEIIEVEEKHVKRSPFDFLNAINSTKKNLIGDNPDLEKEYVPFLINRGLSYHPDAILDANEMNQHHHLDNALQFAYLINILRPRKRFAKWHKGSKDEGDVKVVQHFYGYNRQKAEQALTLLNPLQMKQLRKAYTELKGI